MAGITFSGLASGIDSASIVDQLVALERAPAKALTQRKSDVNKRLTTLGDLTTKLQTLGSRLGEVSTAGEVRAVSAKSADETRVKVTSTSDAQPGTYAVSVQTLARAETSRSRSLTTPDVGVVGVGTLDITVGGDAAVSIAYDGTDSLAAIAQRINDSGARVEASVLDDGYGYRLIVTGTDTGAASGISFAESGDTLGFTAVDAEVMAAQDATATVNGNPVRRATNLFTGVVPGVTLELTGETPVGATATNVSVARDPVALRDKAQAIVDAYNDVAKVVTSQLTYSGTAKGEDTLFGDGALQSLQRQLGSVVTSRYAHGANGISAKELGISLGRDGQLTLDAAKFDAAVAADPTRAESLFAGTTGLGVALDDVVSRFTTSGTGVLAAKQSSLRSQLTSYDEQIARVERAADVLETRLGRQFAALEEAMALMESQQSYITSLFANASSEG